MIILLYYNEEMGGSILTLMEFQNVFYKEKNQIILKDISIKIQRQDYISIVGPSGSGKSTFLKLCCHLISPTQGRILYKNKSLMQYDPIELRKKVSYCFQTPYLFEDNVMNNLAFPYFIRNKKVDFDRIKKLFDLFHLDQKCLQKEIHKLSGGEKQRIALIRTLLFDPDILLLDEVTSALDIENTLIVERVINYFHQKGTTILWITHNYEQSKRNANKVLTIEAGKIKSLEVIR